MAGKIKPVNVPPIIKCARYGFLILGCMYGNLHLAALRAYEKRTRDMRIKMLHDKEERERLRVRDLTINELRGIFKDSNIDLPPGWENEI